MLRCTYIILIENDENNINFNDNEIHENYTYREGE